MDELHTFLFEGQPVRGLFVRLARGWPSLLSRREPDDAHPPVVRNLLGEMAAAAVLMHANLRYSGTLILQIQGDGPLKLAVVEVNADLSYRATAKIVGDLPSDPTLTSLVNANGQGRCAITLDPMTQAPGQQPYQGVVDLRAGRHDAPPERMADVLEHYMMQSEQLASRFVLAADDEGAAGLLIQRLPIEGVGNLEGVAREQKGAQDIDADEAFNRAAHLVATVQSQELLRTDVATVMRRLFWQEDLRVFDVRHPSFACRCSRERVRSMLRSLGQVEVESVLAERGDVEIACDFCGVRFRFDPVDVGEMFAKPIDQPPGSSAIN
jgi:molecular chaperone Hsp33